MKNRLFILLGVDFICRDEEVLKNKGVHVIQTFFSEAKAEQIQIMGRTARQGQEGSYSKISHENDLEKFLGASDLPGKIKKLRDEKKVYSEICKLRDDIFDQSLKSMIENLKNKKEEHETSMKFRMSLLDLNHDLILSYLKNFNVGQLEIIQSKILLLIDGTGSMRPFMDALKTNLKGVFERSSEFLQEKSIPPGSFQIQIAVYRDYDHGLDLILETSPWRNEPKELIIFMSGIKPLGGHSWDEAVEIGLQHANKENNKEKIKYVILVGDAPAKSKKDIQFDRNKFEGESKWENSVFGPATFWENECDSLKGSNTPVYSFFLGDDDDGEKNFKGISSKTNGKYQRLEPKGNVLNDMMCQFIAESMGTGLAQEFNKKYKIKESYI